MLKRSHTLSDLFLITLISCALYLPFLGGVALFDWDEINFAECAREMLITGNFSEVQLNFQPFWEKPPLFIWLQVISMKVFGINEFAARFPNAMCSIFTLSTLYLIGRKEIDRRMGWYWVLFYIGSLLPHFYFRTGIIDPWFNYFILIALYCFFKATANQKNILYFLLSGIFSGLAVLTKGPAALLIIAATLSVYLIWTRQLKKNHPDQWFFILQPQHPNCKC
jgi:4-amino-4-deoxy-L-arabinose transferase-like glycosyltransferase